MELAMKGSNPSRLSGLSMTDLSVSPVKGLVAGWTDPSALRWRSNRVNSSSNATTGVSFCAANRSSTCSNALAIAVPPFAPFIVVNLSYKASDNAVLCVRSHIQNVREADAMIQLYKLPILVPVLVNPKELYAKSVGKTFN